jgi:hypothetical protein
MTADGRAVVNQAYPRCGEPKRRLVQQVFRAAHDRPRFATRAARKVPAAAGYEAYGRSDDREGTRSWAITGVTSIPEHEVRS